MLETIDLSQETSKEEYKRRFSSLQERLRLAQRALVQAKIPLVVVFEGWDAAGKGTAIERLVERLDPRGFKVHKITEPVVDEALRPFLWRFWTRLPGQGEVGIFDRSWYGRVLVERVEKLVSKSVWRQAFQEINELERQLADDKNLIVKFWLHISKKEQKKRFKRIEADPAQTWKVTKEDWRHHRRRGKWTLAVEEMLEKTSTHYAPWTIVEMEDGRFGRLKIVETLLSAVEDGMKQHAPQILEEYRQVLAEDPQAQAPAAPPAEAAPRRRPARGKKKGKAARKRAAAKPAAPEAPPQEGAS